MSQCRLPFFGKAKVFYLILICLNALIEPAIAVDFGVGPSFNIFGNDATLFGNDATTNLTTESILVTSAPFLNVTQSPSNFSTTEKIQTMVPTKSPTKAPTEAQPTEAPTITLTKYPTITPTKMLTKFPSGKSTDLSTIGSKKIKSSAEGVKMVLVGMDEEMNASAMASWKRHTANHIINYFNRRQRIDNLKVTFDIIQQKDESSRRRLGLRSIGQEKDVSDRSLKGRHKLAIFYTQENMYDSISEWDANIFAKEAFETIALRKEYVERLKLTSLPAFLTLESVEEVDIVGTTEDKEQIIEDESADRPKWGRIIGLVLGGGGTVLIIVIFIFFIQRNDQTAMIAKDEPPVNLPIPQVSTLNDRTIPEPNLNNVNSPTVNGADPSVGSTDQNATNTNNNYSYGGVKNFSDYPSGSAAVGGKIDSTSSAQTNGATVTTEPEIRILTNDNATTEGEIIDIYAPPGKLGVIVDTPGDGPPVVKHVKDTSVIGDKIIVGDNLIAVDDEDVKLFTAIKVAKLISRKCTNPTRKLTIVRHKSTSP